MKKTILLILIFLNTFIFAVDKTVFTGLNLAEAQTISKMKGKLIFIKFHADWCHNCVKMDQTTFKNSEIQTTLEAFIAIKIDVDDPIGRKTAQDFNISAIPVVILLDESGKEISRTLGYQSSNQWMIQMSKVNEK